jgi:hypothetical protein
MIRADNKRWARLIFNNYEERLLRKNFTNFYITNNFGEINHSRGLIITPNHISWWDGFFIDFITRRFINRKFHILMLEEQLKKYPFFRKTGAFSINTKSIKGIRETFQYAGDLLGDKKNLLVFYPQGKIEPYDKDPELKTGLKQLLVNRIDVDIIPAAFRIEYQDHKNPALYFRSGEVISSADAVSDYDLFRNKFRENIKKLRDDIHSGRYISDLFAG